MIIGTPSRFAVEFHILKAYAELHSRASGCFFYHVNGVRYGVDEPDASWLANTFDEVERRILRRGFFVGEIFEDWSADQVVLAIEKSLYEDIPEDTLFNGVALSKVSQLIYRNRLLLAPDGDEVFDDGSHLIQLESGTSVRIVAGKLLTREGKPVIRDVSEVVLSDVDFYGILEGFLLEFERVRKRLLDQSVKDFSES